MLRSSTGVPRVPPVSLRYNSRMPLKTKRWNDPVEPDDGFRLLITRYRPRGISKADETWDKWTPQLGPPKELHAAVYTDKASPIPWPQYRRHYLLEQKKNVELIASLAQRVAAGETITLLCSSACVREGRCHRSILRELIEQQIASGNPTPASSSEAEPLA